MSNKYKRFVRNTVEDMPSLPFEKLNSTRGAAKGYVDCDYLSNLSPKDRDWMQKFIQEYYYASVTKIDPLHTKKLHKKSIIKTDYSRRIDVYNLKSVASTIAPLKYDPSSGSPEDAIIEMYDLCYQKK